jgi:hypothetical protein
MNRIAVALLLPFLEGCSTDKPLDTASLEGAQHAYFPDRYEYKVGDFVMSLPIGYYEFAMNRLAFSQRVLEDATPRPVAEQEKYLVMPEYALSPKRHFLLLDQRHLLIFSEFFELEDGYPAKLEVLRRTSDAGWSDVSEQVIPKWARAPKSVAFSGDRHSVKVTGDSGTSQTLFWVDGKLKPKAQLTENHQRTSREMQPATTSFLKPGSPPPVHPL